MLKIGSKRRRTLAQIKADKEAAAQKDADITTKLAMLDELQQQVQALQQQSETNKVASDLMGQFIDAGAVQQSEDNEFTINVNGSPSKFKPFGRQ